MGLDTSTAKKLARVAITEANPHLDWSRWQAWNQRRIYAKNLENTAFEDNEMHLTDRVWSSVVRNGPNSFRVITTVDRTCVGTKEVDLNS